jgi:exodeoxyribonuclease VII small subunit
VGGADAEIGYAEAMDELESLLDEIERDDLDIDLLATRVRRARDLVELCRARIVRAEADVAAIVTDLEDADEPSPEPGRE